MRSTYGIYNIQNTNCKNGMVSHLTASHSCTWENQVQVLALLLHLHATPTERIGLSEKQENPEKFRKQAPHAEKSRKNFDFKDISLNIALHFSHFINNHMTTHKIIEQIVTTQIPGDPKFGPWPQVKGLTLRVPPIPCWQLTKTLWIFFLYISH